MKKMTRILHDLRQKVMTYLKDYRFSSILVKYFLMLFLILVFPVMIVNVWYRNVLQENLQEELILRNEASLNQSFNNVNSVILSLENLAYSIAHEDTALILSMQSDFVKNQEEKWFSLQDTLSVVKTSNACVDSVCVWLKESDMLVTANGIMSWKDYSDQECIALYEQDMPARVVVCSRKKHGVYPNLLTILYPINRNGLGNYGAVVINIDVEKLASTLGSGKYLKKEYAPILLMFEKETGDLIYSDEYWLFQDGKEDLTEIAPVISRREDSFSGIETLWGKRYLVSARTSQEGFLYLYVSPMEKMDSKSEAVNRMYVNLILLMVILCLILSILLALWIYHPIRKTVELLDNASMLIEWDEKNNLDEMESIQKSILLAKKEKDNLNEEIQERIISLHNAQICALQTQINPHFLYNCLESIGNVTALMMGEENKVTESIFTLGRLMRISLSGENYMVSLEEELEHVKLYVKLMELVDPDFRKRIHFHVEIPEELKKERIVKLTLQPLIENSLSHGLSRKRNGGNIWIRGEKSGEKNTLTIIDDGSGMDPKELESLREKLKESAIGGSRHIGLQNVNQRLKLVFGDEYGLLVEQTQNGGLTVTACFRSI